MKSLIEFFKSAQVLFSLFSKFSKSNKKTKCASRTTNYINAYLKDEIEKDNPETENKDMKNG